MKAIIGYISHVKGTDIANITKIMTNTITITIRMSCKLFCCGVSFFFSFRSRRIVRTVVVEPEEIQPNRNASLINW